MYVTLITGENLLKFIHISTVLEIFNKNLNPNIANAIITKTTFVKDKRFFIILECTVL